MEEGLLVSTSRAKYKQNVDKLPVFKTTQLSAPLRSQIHIHLSIVAKKELALASEVVYFLLSCSIRYSIGRFTSGTPQTSLLEQLR